MPTRLFLMDAIKIDYRNWTGLTKVQISQKWQLPSKSDCKFIDKLFDHCSYLENTVAGEIISKCPHRTTVLNLQFQNLKNTKDWNISQGLHINSLDNKIWPELIAFPYCIITQFSVNIEMFLCRNTTDLDSLLAMLCSIQCIHTFTFPFLRKKFLNPEIHLASKCSDMSLWTSIIPYWWWEWGFFCYLGAVPRVVIDKIQQHKNHYIET